MYPYDWDPLPSTLFILIVGPLHTCIKCFHTQLWLWLVVVGIRMQPQSDVCLVSQSQVSPLYCILLLMLYLIRCYHPLHTHSRSTSYIHVLFPHLLLWLVGIRMQPQSDVFEFDLTVKGGIGDSPGFAIYICNHGHWLHHYIWSGCPTYFILSRYISYIYKVFQHLLQWLVVMRMQLHQSDLLSFTKGAGVGDSPGFAMGLHCYIWLGRPTHFILIAVILHTYIKCFSTCYSG
jgi:hypothetical protein